MNLYVNTLSDNYIFKNYKSCVIDEDSMDGRALLVVTDENDSVFYFNFDIVEYFGEVK